MAGKAVSKCIAAGYAAPKIPDLAMLIFILLITGVVALRNLHLRCYGIAVQIRGATLLCPNSDVSDLAAAVCVTSYSSSVMYT